MFLFILIKSLSAVADLHQSCLGNFYIHVSNKNKVGVFLGSSGFKENSNEKIFVYSSDVEDKKFIQSFNLVLNIKNVSDGTYLVSDLCDCDVDFTEASYLISEIDGVGKKNFEKCLSRIKFEKIGDTQFSYFYEKMKWIFLSKFY